MSGIPRCFIHCISAFSRLIYVGFEKEFVYKGIVYTGYERSNFKVKFCSLFPKWCFATNRFEQILKKWNNNLTERWKVKSNILKDQRKINLLMYVSKIFNRFDIFCLWSDNVQHANMAADDRGLHITSSKLISEPSAIFKPCYLYVIAPKSFFKSTL